MLSAIRHTVLDVIDFFHKPFSKWIDTQTFRYLACGGSNQVWYIFIYWLTDSYFLHERDVMLLLPGNAAPFAVHFFNAHEVITQPHIHITAAILSWVIAFSITFPMGFILSRHIVFPESNLHGFAQFFRYAMLTITCILLTYILLKFFVEICDMNHLLSAIITSGTIAVFSYFMQRKFTFKVKEVI
jgi:putative flippase GtrA